MEQSTLRRLVNWSSSVGRIENEFDLIGFTSEVDGLGLSIGIERGLTQTTRFRAEVGVAQTELNGGESDTDPVWDFNLVRALETVTLYAAVAEARAGGVLFVAGRALHRPRTPPSSSRRGGILRYPREKVVLGDGSTPG